MNSNGPTQTPIDLSVPTASRPAISPAGLGVHARKNPGHAAKQGGLAIDVDAGDLPNLPDDGREFDPVDVLRARGFVDEDADWRCRGCGLRADATKLRVCPDCGETIFEKRPRDGDADRGGRDA